MSFARSKIIPWLYLLTGLLWLVSALRNFDRLGFLNVYLLHGYRGLHPHGDAGLAILQSATALMSLIAAAVGFLKSRRDSQGNAEPVVTTLFGQK